MAESFTRVLYNVTSSLAALYTCPSGRTAIVVGCQAANKSSSNTNVSLTMNVDSGASNQPLVKDVTIPSNSSLEPIAGKLILLADDELQAQTGTTGDVGLIVSILELY